MNFDRINPATVTAVFLKGDAWHQVRWDLVDGQWRSSLELDPEEGVVTFHGRGLSGDELSQFVTRTDEIAAVRVHSDPEHYAPVPSDFNQDAGKFMFSVWKE